VASASACANAISAIRSASPKKEAIDSSCECEHNTPDSLDARLFPSVVLAVAPAMTMDEASSLSEGKQEAGWCLGSRCPVRLSDSTSSVLESKRRNSESLAQAPEQSKFTHSGSFVATGHLLTRREVSSSDQPKGGSLVGLIRGALCA